MKLPNFWHVALGSVIHVADVSKQHAALISINIYSNEKCFEQNLYRETKHILCSVKFLVHIAAFETNTQKECLRPR